MPQGPSGLDTGANVSVGWQSVRACGFMLNPQGLPSVQYGRGNKADGFESKVVQNGFKSSAATPRHQNSRPAVASQRRKRRPQPKWLSVRLANRRDEAAQDANLAARTTA